MYICLSLFPYFLVTKIILYKIYILFRVVKLLVTSGVTNQSAAFDPHADVGPVLLKLKAKRLQLRRDTLTRDQGMYTFEAPCT